MSCDGSHPADCSGRESLRWRGRPLLNVASPARWDQPMTQIAGDAWFRTRDRADGVLQVAWCRPMYALVDQYAQTSVVWWQTWRRTMQGCRRLCRCWALDLWLSATVLITPISTLSAGHRYSIMYLIIGNKSVPKIIINCTINFFLNCNQHFGNFVP